MVANLEPRYTLKEYFELEKNSEEKYEYFNGEVFCMSGTTPSHSRINVNLAVSFDNKARQVGCRVYDSGMRVKSPTLPPYRYPDLTVVCGKEVFEMIGGLEALVNPVLIVEVLSPSTEAFDRGDKFSHYKSIPSFREYLLVAQHRAHITHFHKLSDGRWEYEEINGLENQIELQSIDCVLSLGEIYRDVEFDVPALPPLTTRAEEG